MLNKNHDDSIQLKRAYYQDRVVDYHHHAASFGKRQYSYVAVTTTRLKIILTTLSLSQR